MDDLSMDDYDENLCSEARNMDCCRTCWVVCDLMVEGANSREKGRA